jgi:cell division protein FtsQ
VKKKGNRYRKDPNRLGGPRHWLSVGLLLAGISALVLAAGVTFSRAYWAVLDSSLLALRAVDVKGLVRVDRRTVLNTLGVPRDANMLQLHLDDLRGRLEALPWVRAAEIRLEPQGRLVVSVVERRPAALVMVGTPLLMDEDGTLFAEAKPQEHLDLPFVTRLGEETLQVGSRVPARFLEDFRDLMETMRALAGEGHARLGSLQSAVSEIRWDPDDGTTLVLNPRGLTVHLGRGDCRRKLLRLERVLEAASRHPAVSEVLGVDLDFRDQARLRARLAAARGI